MSMIDARICASANRQFRLTTEAFGVFSAESKCDADIAMLEVPLRHARRVVTAVVGFTVLVLGLVMLVTPGPGWLIIFLGLSILGAEFLWARRLLKRMKRVGVQVKDSIMGRNGERREEVAAGATEGDSSGKSAF